MKVKPSDLKVGQVWVIGKAQLKIADFDEHSIELFLLPAETYGNFFCMYKPKFARFLTLSSARLQRKGKK